MNTRRKGFLGVLVVGLTVFVHGLAALLDIPKLLGEHAVVAWIDDQIAEKFDIRSPTTDQVVQFVVTWAPAGTFAALLFLAGWVGYALAHRKKPSSLKNSDHEVRAAEGLIRIDVGEAGEFFETKRGSLYTHKRILKLRVSNSDQHRSLTGCKVFVTDISPHEYDGPWLLKEGFSLAAGDHEFLPLASYTEPDNIKISTYGATFMEILTTKNRPLPPSNMPHVLTIRAIALESPFYEIKCKLWVDDTGRLRIDTAISTGRAERQSAGALPSTISESEWDQASPLQIIFDPTNPARRFWSLEPAQDKDGSPRPGSYWEHRVEIRNNSRRTLRNVSVTTEHLGQLPVRPADQTFDRTKTTSCDLKPGCSELVPVVRWPNPKIQAGMLADRSALEYGPIKITASADNIMPCVRTFKFDYQTEQMLFDRVSLDTDLP
jgi:hypothetical protein